MAEFVEGVREKSGPEPERLMVCGLPEASSSMITLPFLVPSAVGVKVTETVQFAPTASDEPQVWFASKSPVTLTADMFKAAAPGFERVTVCAALVVPIARAAKTSASEDRVSAGVSRSRLNTSAPPSDRNAVTMKK